MLQRQVKELEPSEACVETATANLANLLNAIPYTRGKDLKFIREFFGKNSHFLLGINAP